MNPSKQNCYDFLKKFLLMFQYLYETTNYLYFYLFIGLCKSEMRSYMRCLMANNRENSKCRSEAKSYLQCRMDK